MRVIAIESLKDGVCRSYGEGELLGDKVPDDDFLGLAGVKNPCIKLDSGKYVWGFECWWGEAKKFKEKYDDAIKETIMVEPKNTLPKKTVNTTKSKS